ncbi:MAG TPA: hypothetical protein VIV61_08020 [Candidatus Ozemobacteraceae bacterium]
MHGDTPLDESLIPFGDFCYSLLANRPGSIPGEGLYLHGETRCKMYVGSNTTYLSCPHWERTDHGVVLCRFTGKISPDEWDDHAHEKIVAHFGSYEAMYKHPFDGYLYDELKCCGIRTDAIEDLAEEGQIRLDTLPLPFHEVMARWLTFPDAETDATSKMIRALFAHHYRVPTEKVTYTYVMNEIMKSEQPIR